jgi:two-component system, OmpR family, phosphate regulon sensor histidine kinase PhoR
LLVDVIREFLRATTSRLTYSPHRNHYILFGLLWGIPIPVVAFMIEWQMIGPVGRGRELSDFISEPLNIFLALHPVFFAIVFGALGTIRHRKEKRIQILVDQLAGEVRSLSKANAELRELDRLKDEFVSNVTHELKTPLVMIRGYTEMLSSNRLGDLSEPQHKAVSVMNRNVLRLQEQIDLILSSGRDREMLENVQTETVELKLFVLDAIDRNTPAAELKGVNLGMTLPPDPVTVAIDRQRITEVLDNLLSNAIKFTDKGGRVAIAFGDPEGGYLPITVSDTGCGIPENAREEIFDRFRQADGSISRKYGGSGLGLAIVRRNLELHGCQIRVDSKEGKGSRFRFNLPLAGSEQE